MMKTELSRDWLHTSFSQYFKGNFWNDRLFKKPRKWAPILKLIQSTIWKDNEIFLSCILKGLFTLLLMAAYSSNRCDPIQTISLMKIALSRDWLHTSFSQYFKGHFWNDRIFMKPRKWAPILKLIQSLKGQWDVSLMHFERTFHSPVDGCLV